MLYDHRVFYGLSATISGRARISFNHVMIPENLTSVRYSKKEEGVVDMYEVDDDFYNRYQTRAWVQPRKKDTGERDAADTGDSEQDDR